MTSLLRHGAILVGATTLTLAGAALPAAAAVPSAERAHVLCADPHGHEGGAAARGAGGDRQGPDHRDVSAQEQRAIDRRTDRILDGRGVSSAEARQEAAAASIPVYVHVMRADDGSGDVTDQQIVQQIEVLNETFAGAESAESPNTGFSFTLADVERYNNDTWHQDKASKSYRKKTRRGGADALNMWIVDFAPLGVATFPWDYAQKGEIDGIRVNYLSLPGGPLGTNYSLGKTATHEAGHWLGLFHTFQGGCTPVNDGVADTPAQGSPTGGCPEGRDSCELPGLDPIHNYMDYSFDSCYDRFSGGQSTRMANMFAAYRA